MKKLITCLTMGLLVVGAQSLKAQSATTTTSTNSVASPAPGAHKEMTPEQRQERKAVLKLIGLTKEDLAGLKGKELRAKIKEAADKFIADLKAKKSSGSLSETDQANLERVEKFIAHPAHKKPATPPADTTPAPAQ